MQRIQKSSEHPRYWQLDGRPVLLLGGSVEDNLFQVPDLEAQLDALEDCGGNYVRCTMSCRDEGDLWPFERGEDGLYDLRRPNQEFWARFERFLDLTEARRIVAQVEVWATFDFYRRPWARNPFNPANNVNYTAEESGLPAEVPTHPNRAENPFFFTVPEAQDNPVVLPFQRQFVERLMDHALPRPNVLWCMDNETSVTPAWPRYWAEYIRLRAGQEDLHVEVTEMWDAHELDDPQHAHSFDHPELYSFVDVSQNNHQVGEDHWLNMGAALARLEELPRPANNVKIYGAPRSTHATGENGLESFWRNILGGCASARFHRPESGWGLSPTARAHIQAARAVTDSVDIFHCRRHNDLLLGRTPNQAYCAARPGREAVVFFTCAESLELDTSAFDGPLWIRWMDPDAGRWIGEPERRPAAGRLPLTPPFGPRAVAVVKGQ